MQINPSNEEFYFQSKMSLNLIGDDFRVTQIQTSCLAQHSYIIESKNECAIIDPQREPQPYLDYLQKHSLSLKYVMMTHVHADFLSGHLELKKQNENCQIIYGPSNKVEYEVITANDDQSFQLGSVSIRLLHTPGHTMESSCYLLNEQILFTGDTLFLGDVGRPDLAANSLNLTVHQMASHMYDSIQKIKQLKEDIIVLTGHGSGSPCGKNIQSGTHCTLKNQKQTNYALSDSLSKEQFIDQLCANIPKPSNWFAQNVNLNLKGYESLDSLVKQIDYDIDINEAVKLMKQENYKLVDCRYKKDIIEKGYIKGSYPVYMNTSVAQMAGQLLNASDRFIILSQKSDQEEIVVRFNRIGYSNIKGFIDSNAFDDYKGELKHIQLIDSEQVVKKQEESGYQIKLMDVRKVPEFTNGHCKNALHHQLDWIAMNPSEVLEFIDKNYKEDTIYVSCQSGMRSTLAIHMLQNLDIQKNFINVEGGFLGLKKNGAQIE